MLTRWLMMATTALLAMLSGCRGGTQTITLAGVAPFPIPHQSIKLLDPQVQPRTVQDGDTVTITAVANATDAEVDLTGELHSASGGDSVNFSLHDDGLDGDETAGDMVWTHRFILDAGRFPGNDLSGTLNLKFLITPYEGGEYEPQYADLPGITVEDGTGTD